MLLADALQVVEDDLVEARQTDRTIGSRDFNRLETDLFCDVSKSLHCCNVVAYW